MTCSVDTSQPFSPVIPSLPKQSHEQMVMMERSQAQHYELSHTKVNLTKATAEWSICQHQSSHMASLPRIISHLLDIILYWTDFTMKEEIFLTTIDTLHMHLPSLHSMLLSKPSPVTYRIPYPSSWYFAQSVLLLIKGLISQQKKCSDGHMLMEFPGITMFSTLLKELA